MKETDCLAVGLMWRPERGDRPVRLESDPYEGDREVTVVMGAILHDHFAICPNVCRDSFHLKRRWDPSSGPNAVASLSPMDLRQLQAFLAVVDHGGFTAAAKATHTVQSNISTHVARLERELNATLVDRSSGKPTQEGEAVLARARRIQSELAALEADVSSLQGSPRGTVRLGLIGTTARWMTPLLVNRLKLVAPDIHLVIADGTTSSQTLRILEGDLDLGLLSLPINDAEIRTSALFDEDHVVVVPSKHPLAGKTGTVSLADLTEFELMLSSPGTTFRQEVDAAFRAQDLRPRAQFEIDGLRLLASLAFQGFGIAIVPATAAPGWIGGEWTIIEVDGLGRRTVGLATRRRSMLSVAAQTTANVVQQIISSEAPSLTGIHLHTPQT